MGQDITQLQVAYPHIQVKEIHIIGVATGSPSPKVHGSVPVKLDKGMCTDRRGTGGIRTQWSLPGDCRSGRSEVSASNNESIL